jgi:hypothetical protein
MREKLELEEGLAPSNEGQVGTRERQGKEKGSR